MRPGPTAPLLACLAVLATLPACIENNTRGRLGDTLDLPLLADGSGVPTLAVVDGATPSLTGLDRSNWARLNFEVPIDGVEHRPLYTTNREKPTRTARSKGAFPSPRSSLEERGATRGEQYAESFLSPIYAAWDFIRLPYFLYKDPAWKDRTIARGTEGSYWRGTVFEPRRAQWAEVLEPAPRPPAPPPPPPDPDDALLRQSPEP